MGEALSRMAPTDLRCEYLTHPMGIDVTQPFLSWVLTSRERDQWQTAYQVLAASSLASLERNSGDLWDSGRVKRSDQSQVAYAGQSLQSHQTIYWKVRVWDNQGQPSGWSKPAQWTMGLLKFEDWSAQWIGPKQVNPISSRPAPILRKTFHVAGTPRRALLYVCGLGFHEVRLNGKKVGDAVLEPGWTNYRKRLLYSAYDVTAMLQTGRNALAVLLGNGMYHVAGGRYVKFKGAFGDPKLLLHLRIECAEGETTAVVSDSSWRAAPSPITFNCIYGGEDYDARAEIPGWDQAEGDDSPWAAVQVLNGPGGQLSTLSSPPSRIMEELAPVRITQPQPGVFIYDLGKNFSGWPAVTVQGPRGATVKLIPGELLDPRGLVTQRSSGGPVSFSYTLKGGRSETWHPRFTYYGFRYVQVEGAVPQGEAGSADWPRLHSLKGHFVHAAGRPVGQFACSNPLLNQIHELITAAMRCNFQSVLTDCPHREKLGWLEVSHLLARSLLYNFDGARFYTKICNDMAEAQRPNGLVPDIAPEYTVFSGGFVDSPEWGSALVINPWHIYEVYGDSRPLARHYEAMKSYVKYLETQAKDHILSHGLGDWYDVGPNPPGESQLTSKGVTATAIYYQDLRLLERTARLLGKPAEEAHYQQLAGAVGQAFHRTFFKPDQGSYDRNSQTANAMPLVLGLVEQERREAVLTHLVEQIRADGSRVTAGDIGFGYLVRALCDGGKGDVLFHLVCQTNGPGYAEQLRRGATTLTEAWDANPASSQNHCMLGHAGEWLYRGLAGLVPDPAQPAFKHFQIRPQLVGDLTWVKASHDSLRGRIVSEWKIAGKRLELQVAVPPNSSATVYLPAPDLQRIQESQRPVRQARGVRAVRMEDGCAVLEIGSGEYWFTAEGD